MTDREMLELAAKAAGLAGKYYEYEDGFGRLWGFKPEGAKTGRDHWNPLADDGDAFRLMTKLDLDLMRTERDIEAIATLAPHAKVNAHDIVAPSAIELIGGDKAAATRRAITRAAAAIQEAKEGV